jgi:hypothetical protein
MSVSVNDLALPVLDGRALPAAHRELLRPGDLVRARDGQRHRLPRYFYQIDSWTLARETQITPHFALWEFIDVDVREAAPLRVFPRYVPCAVTLLAAALEMFRFTIGAPVRIAANGGYRSPAHGGSDAGSPHCWAAAADIFAIGADLTDSEERIGRFGAVARAALPFFWVRPYGIGPGATDDHLHVDIGYVTLVPPGASEHDDAGSSP